MVMKNMYPDKSLKRFQGHRSVLNPEETPHNIYGDTLIKEARAREGSSAPGRKADIVVTNLERASGPIVGLATGVVQ